LVSSVERNRGSWRAFEKALASSVQNRRQAFMELSVWPIIREKRARWNGCFLPLAATAASVLRFGFPRDGMSESASFGESGRLTHILRFRLLQQYNIGIGVAADQAQLAAVERPVKVVDFFRFEVGDLFSRRAVERLQPEVIRLLVMKGIDYTFAVMSETDKSRPPGSYSRRSSMTTRMWPRTTGRRAE
jgi:hypothetical protein